MKEKKGNYSFEWKHERKSWQSARAIIYFDIGANYLLKRTGDQNFKKIMVTEFLAEHGITATN